MLVGGLKAGKTERRFPWVLISGNGSATGVLGAPDSRNVEEQVVLMLC